MQKNKKASVAAFYIELAVNCKKNVAKPSVSYWLLQNFLLKKNVKISFYCSCKRSKNRRMIRIAGANFIIKISDVLDNFFIISLIQKKFNHNLKKL